jgi:hypothetical protein
MAVASLDLQLVQLLRGAMRAADIGAGGACGVPTASPSLQPAPHLQSQPAATIEPRRHITPTAYIAPRPVFHPEPHFVPPVVAAAEPPAHPEVSRITKSPIEPPWKVHPWKIPTPPPAKIKVLIRQPDVPIKGTVFDVFI